MSYSSDLKKRLTLSELRSKCCASAELYAAFLMNGSVVFTSSEKNEIRRINALAQKSGEKSFQRRILSESGTPEACCGERKLIRPGRLIRRVFSERTAAARPF